MLSCRDQKIIQALKQKTKENGATEAEEESAKNKIKEIYSKYENQTNDRFKKNVDRATERINQMYQKWDYDTSDIKFTICPICKNMRCTEIYKGIYGCLECGHFFNMEEKKENAKSCPMCKNDINDVSTIKNGNYYMCRSCFSIFSYKPDIFGNYIYYIYAKSSLDNYKKYFSFDPYIIEQTDYKKFIEIYNNSSRWQRFKYNFINKFIYRIVTKIRGGQNNE